MSRQVEIRLNILRQLLVRMHETMTENVLHQLNSLAHAQIGLADLLSKVHRHLHKAALRRRRLLLRLRSPAISQPPSQSRRLAA